MTTPFDVWAAEPTELYLLRSARVWLNHEEHLATPPPENELAGLHELMSITRMTAFRFEALRVFEVLLRFPQEIISEDLTEMLCITCLRIARLDPCTDVRRLAAIVLRRVINRVPTILEYFTDLPECIELCASNRLTPLEVEELVDGIRNEIVPPISSTLTSTELNAIMSPDAWAKAQAARLTPGTADPLARLCEKLADAVDPDQTNATAHAERAIKVGLDTIIMSLLNHRDGVRVPAFKAAIGIIIASNDKPRALTVLNAIEKLYDTKEDWFEDWGTSMTLQMYSYFPDIARDSSLLDKVLACLPRWVGYRLPDYVWWITEVLIWSTDDERRIYNAKGCLRPVLEIYRESCLSNLLTYRWVDQAYDEIERALGSKTLRKETARLLGYSQDWSRQDKRSHLARQDTSELS